MWRFKQGDFEPRIFSEAHEQLRLERFFHYCCCNPFGTISSAKEIQ